MTKDEVLKELRMMHSYYSQFNHDRCVSHCEALHTAITAIEQNTVGVTENHCQRCGKAVKEGVELCDKCMYEAQEEMEQYNRLYEPTYNPSDGSM